MFWISNTINILVVINCVLLEAGIDKISILLIDEEYTNVI